MYLIKLDGFVIGVEELSVAESKSREAEGFTVIRIK